MARINTIQLYRTLGTTDPGDLSFGELCFVEHSDTAGTNATLMIGSSNGTEVQIGGSGTKAVPAAGATITGNSLGVTAANDAAATLFLKGDNSDDAGDDWEIVANTGQTLTFENDKALAGTGVALMTLTPHATAVNSTAAFAGDLTVAGNLTVTGNNDYSDLAAGDLPNHSGVLITTGTVAAARVATLNQDTSGTAAIATTVTLADNEDTAENNAIPFGAGAAYTGNVGLETDGHLYYTPSTGKITATGFVGALTGAVTGAVTGNADSATVAGTVTLADNESTNESNPIWFSAGAAGSGSVAPEADGDLTYNPSTGLLSTPKITVGDLDVTGTTTQVDSTNVLVKDKEIYLGVAGGTTEATYRRDGTTMTITSSSHGLSIGDEVLIVGAGNNIVDQIYTTISPTSSNTITVTVVSTGGNITSDADCWHSVTALTASTASGSGIFVPGDDMKSIKWDSSDNWVTSDDLKVTGVIEQTGTTLTLGNGTTINNSTTALCTITEATVAITGDLTVSGDYNLATGDIPDNGADTSGKATTAGTADLVTITNKADDVDYDVVFGNSTSALYDDTGTLTYNPNDATLTCTNFAGDITGDVTGTVATATVATTVTLVDNEDTAENNAIPFGAGAAYTGNVGLETDGHLYYTPSTGKITATGFIGTLTGNVSGDVSGSSGSCSGLAATATAPAGNFAVANGDALVVGHTGPIAFGDITAETQIMGTTEADATLAIGLWSTTDALSPTIKLMKSGHAAIGASNNTTVADNEELGKIQAYGADGTDLATLSSEIAFNIDDDGVGAGTLGGEILLKTSGKDGTLDTAMTIDSSQNVTFANAIDGGSF